MNITQGHSIRFRREILDETGTIIIRQSEFTKNLILDAGLEMLASNNSVDCWKVLVLGTGNKPTKRDSGTVTATLNAGTVTASGAFFEAADVGRTLKFDSSSKEYVITEYQTAETVLVSSADTVAASEFTVWYGNEITHQSEHSRITTFATDAGMNGYSYDAPSATWTNIRTFLSPTFATGALIKEIGWAPSTTGGSQLYGRALIPGGGDFVAAGQKYRVRVEHSMTWGPIAPVSVANICPDAGFDSAGQYQVERIYRCSAVDANGGGTFLSGTYRSNMEPTGHAFWLNLAYTGNAYAGALQWEGFGGGFQGLPDTNFQNNAGAAGYVAGSRRRTWSFKFGVNDGNSAAIDSVLLNADFNKGIRHKFTTPQTKTSLYELTLAMGIAWNRTLSNTAG